jgi:hypothetical protein
MNPEKPSTGDALKRDLGLAIKRVLEDMVIVGDKVYKKEH